MDNPTAFQTTVQTIKSVQQYVAKKWWLLAIGLCIGGGLGAVYAAFQKPKYEAVTTFILEEKSPGGSGLAGLASQFGLSLGGLTSGGGIFSGDNILSILKSKKVVNEVLLTPMDAQRETTLADAYLEFSGLKKKWRDKPALSNFCFCNKQLTPLADSVLNVVYEKVIKANLDVERSSKQGSIIKTTVTAENSEFARLLAQRLVNNASNLYLDLRTRTAEQNIDQLQRRSDSLLILLNRKSFAAAASQPLDINPGLRTAIVPQEIATRDKTVLATLYAEVTKNLEASKVLLSQQTPVIQLLDQPSLLLNDHRLGFALLVIAGAVGGCFIGLCVLLARFMLLSI